MFILEVAFPKIATERLLTQVPAPKCMHPTPAGSGARGSAVTLLSISKVLALFKEVLLGARSGLCRFSSLQEQARPAS